MKLHYDKTTDALHLRLDESQITDSEEREPGVILDYNSKGLVIGIEILGVRERTPDADLSKLALEIAE